MISHIEQDLLSMVLARLHLRARVFALPSVCGAWQIDPSDHPGAQFHLISRGSGYLILDDQPAQSLRSGDLCVFPRGAWHLISSTPKPRGQGNWERPDQTMPYTSMICGEFEFEQGTPPGLLDALPDAIVIPAEQVDERFSALLRLLADESLHVDSGSNVVLDRLADALFVMVLRHHIKRTENRRGLLAAAADKRIAAALLAMHSEPGKPWTVASLATLSGMSRTAFSARFSELMEVSPMAYLTRWRMHEAERLFADPRNSVARVAEQLGYETEAAFRRAYKRVTGQTPGSVRRRVA